MSLNFSFGGQTPAATRTLLLVEDDASLLFAVRTFFTRHGWHLLTAENVAEGIALFTANHQHIDAVLTDYDFPNGQTGLDLVTHIQMRQPGFPCVVMSAHWTEAKRPKDEVQANLFYRAKPFAMAAMVALLVEVSGHWERLAVAEG
jgi:DNA-binding NtrC family response regulator